ncbi:MAG: hypothetical protein V1846_01710 [Candidatus Komeilibacteria bacterium]
MKIYAIIITIIALGALGAAGYLYWQGGGAQQDLKACQDQSAGLAQDKSQLESKLTDTTKQLATISHTTAVLKSALGSFMFAGDITAQTVGAPEAIAVEQVISQLDDSATRMLVTKDWTDFKTTKNLNPLLGLLRNLVNSLNTSATQNQPAAN